MSQVADSTRGLCRAFFREQAPELHVRSEEHTSELQSQSNLVCRLLLEKKKQTYQQAGPRHAEAPATTHLSPSPHRASPRTFNLGGRHFEGHRHYDKVTLTSHYPRCIR